MRNKRLAESRWGMLRRATEGMFPLTFQPIHLAAPPFASQQSLDLPSPSLLQELPLQPPPPAYLLPSQILVQRLRPSLSLLDDSHISPDFLLTLVLLAPHPSPLQSTLWLFLGIGVYLVPLIFRGTRETTGKSAVSLSLFTPLCVASSTSFVLCFLFPCLFFYC